MTTIGTSTGATPGLGVGLGAGSVRRRSRRQGWWAAKPEVVMCELDGCGCPIQRTPAGSLDDGMRLHVATVHLGSRPRAIDDPAAGMSTAVTS